MTLAVTTRHVACLLATLCTPGAAQLSGTIDFGAGPRRSDRADPGTVTSFAPSLRFESTYFSLAGSGTYTDTPGNRWNLQGMTSASVRTPRAGRIRGEVIGRTDWTSHDQVAGTATLEGEARLEVAASVRDRIWIAQSLGNAWTLHQRRTLARRAVGTSTLIGPIRLDVSVASTSFDVQGGTAPPLADSATTAEVTDSLARGRQATFTDATIGGLWSSAALDLEVELGRRFSQNTPETMLWRVSAIHHLTPQVSVLASTGRTAPDPVRSLPGLRYLVMGFRMSLGRPSSTIPVLAAPVTRAPFRIEAGAGNGREIVFLAPTARTVQVIGDFTDWNPVSLSPGPAGEWRTTLPIEPGLHRLAVRLDGGTWRSPPGTRAIVSEFGIEVGELVVQ